MGNKIRRSRASSSDETVEESPLDLKLAQAIQLKIQKQGSTVKSFNGLMMKFPILEKGFTKARKLFNRIDTNSDGSIDPTEFKASAQLLGLDGQTGALASFFSAADVDDSQKIEINEFIVLLSICSLLGDEGNQAEHLDEEISRALKIVEEAFFYFDSSKDGYMDKTEVFEAMGETSNPRREKLKDDEEIRVASERFAELDWDHSGKVGFKEFLLGVQKWVMVDDEDDDE